jgi:hypothetical protein
VAAGEGMLNSLVFSLSTTVLPLKWRYSNAGYGFNLSNVVALEASRGTLHRHDGGPTLHRCLPPQNSHNVCEFCKPMKNRGVMPIEVRRRFLLIAMPPGRDSATALENHWEHLG